MFKIFFLKKELKSLFNKATKAIYSEQFEFSDLVNYLSINDNKNNLLKSYIVIQIVTEKVIPISKAGIEKAMELYLDIKSKSTNSSETELYLSYHKTKAEIGFLESKEYFTYGELAYKTNEYSYEGLKYKIEKIKKGPLTITEHEKFKALSQQINESENTLQEYSIQSIDEKKINETFNKIKLEVQKENEITGYKTDEEIDKEYEELIKEFRKTIK